jgi:hypothetical protein
MYPGYPEPAYEVPAAPLKHSGLGIASFAVALLIGAGLFMLILVAGVMSLRTPGGRMDEKAPLTMALGCAILVGVLGNLAGLVLGIVGLCQQDRKKLFAILGVIFNGLAVAAVAALIVLGTVAGRRF